MIDGTRTPPIQFGRATRATFTSDPARSNASSLANPVASRRVANPWNNFKPAKKYRSLNDNLDSRIAGLRQRYTNAHDPMSVVGLYSDILLGAGFFRYVPIGIIRKTRGKPGRLEAFRKHASSLTRAMSGKPISLGLLQTYSQYPDCGRKYSRAAHVQSNSGKEKCLEKCL
jgi:hypothetical protein